MGILVVFMLTLPWRKKGMKKLRHAMRKVTTSTSTHCRCETRHVADQYTLLGEKRHVEKGFIHLPLCETRHV